MPMGTSRPIADSPEFLTGIHVHNVSATQETRFIKNMYHFEKKKLRKYCCAPFLDVDAYLGYNVFGGQ